MRRIWSLLLITAMTATVFVLASCNRFSKPTTDARPKWAHIPGQPQMGSIAGQLMAMKNKISTNRKLLDVCVYSHRDDFRNEDFVLESKLAYASWFKETGLKSEDWQQLNFVTTRPCSIDEIGFTSILLMPSVETDIGSHALSYRPATTWCVFTNETNLLCQTDPLSLGFGGMASLKLSRMAEQEKWNRIDYTSPAGASLSPFVKWVSLRESILSNTSLDQKVKDGLIGRLNGLEKKESFEKYVELAALLEKYELKGVATADDQKTRTLILQQPVLAGVRVPFIPRISAFHVMLHEVGHLFGLDHSDNSSPQSITGNASGTISSERVVEKNTTMAYGEPLFYLTADDKAGIRNVMKTIEQNFKEFDVAQ